MNKKLVIGLGVATVAAIGSIVIYKKVKANNNNEEIDECDEEPEEQNKEIEELADTLVSQYEEALEQPIDSIINAVDKAMSHLYVERDKFEKEYKDTEKYIKKIEKQIEEDNKNIDDISKEGNE